MPQMAAMSQSDKYMTMRKTIQHIFLMSIGLLLCNSAMAFEKDSITARKVMETFRNPVINADVPDMSVTRAGNDYYMISTTMHLMPGAPIMRSKDLVHWETVNYVFDKLTDHSRYDLIDGTVYGHGQWASSIRYHNGKFYVLFSPNDEPYSSYIYTADDPTEKWTLISRTRHFHDASLFFDDDGRVYVFYGTGEVQELENDLSGVKSDGLSKKIFERDEEEYGLLEGSQMIKHNGKYYLLMISMVWDQPGRVRRQVCYRADNIAGPYEKKVILEHDFDGYGGVGQGCIIDSPEGDWYGVIFQDRGGIGRVPTLMPCTWVDEWPMLGNDKGEVPLFMTKEVYPDAHKKGIVGSDNFDSETLSLYWQWNHNPINEMWSLTERPGHLRLKTARVVDNLFMAPNTITQRMEGPKCEATILLDLSKMKDGDITGFSAFNSPAGVIAIAKEGRKKFLLMNVQNADFSKNKHHIEKVNIEPHTSIDLKQNQVYLRIKCDFTPKQDWATFYYSLDNKNWQQVGVPVKMIFDHTRMFMGSKFAIFTYATKQLGGYVDVAYFDYLKEDPLTVMMGE